MSRIEGLQQDQQSLEHEIAELQQKKADLMKQIEKARKKRPVGRSYDQLLKLLHTPNKSPPKKTRLSEKSPEPSTSAQAERDLRRKRRIEEDYVEPDPIKHEFFDESISKYFQQPKKAKAASASSVVDHSEKINNVLLENVYRMIGITAFPAHNPSSAHLKTPPELLGVRIEVFNELDLYFETAHYFLLEKNSKTEKWRILHHTVPAFVQVHELATEYDGLEDTQLLKFLKTVRNILNKTSLKHQYLDKIKKEMRKHVKMLQKDIAMDNLKFTLEIGDAVANVVMKCDIDDVVSCSVENGFSETECARIARVLKGDIKTLQRRLESVVRSM